MALSTKLTVRNSQLSLGVSVIDARTEVSYVIPAAAIRYVSLKLDAALDTQNRNPYVSDFFVAVDTAQLGVGKGFDDLIGTSDSLLGFGINKGLLEDVTPLEVIDISVGFIRAFADNAPAVDVFGMNFSTIFNESISVVDNIAIGTILSKEDVSVIFDDADVNQGPDWAFGKSTVELIGASDEATSSFEKALADTFSLTDSPIFAVEKVLADLIGATDAVSSFDNGKALEDSATQTDEITSFDTGKSLEDIFSGADSLVFDTSKALEDTYGSTDSLTTDVGKALDDTFTGADSISAFDIGPVYADSVSAAEAAVLYYQTTYSDTFSVSDVTISSINKALDDNISGMADSGSLYMTDYCDITYFAEAYVGTYQTF